MCGMNVPLVIALVVLGTGAGALLAGAVAVVLVRRLAPTASPAEAALEAAATSARLDQVRVEVRDEIDRLGRLVAQLGERNAQQFGQVDAALRVHAEVAQTLSANTQSLREALANPKARGQWGERMAEDVLRHAGFVEHVNYEKQTSVEGGRAIPDFTFLLPKGHVLYMDVKFPLSSYLRYLDASNDAERSAHCGAFLRDVRLRVRELATRDYARVSTAPALDYVLLFLPNETLSSFIHEHDPDLIDDALRQRVVLCSPLNLFSFLGVIRQAFDTFVIEQTSDEILALLGVFGQQWSNYTDAMETVKKRLDSTQRAFDELTGARRRQLEKPLQALEQLRRERGLPDDRELFRAG
jgi:DNA recombination protein RmuC